MSNQDFQKDAASANIEAPQKGEDGQGGVKSPLFLVREFFVVVVPVLAMMMWPYLVRHPATLQPVPWQYFILYGALFFALVAFGWFMVMPRQSWRNCGKTMLLLLAIAAIVAKNNEAAWAINATVSKPVGAAVLELQALRTIERHKAADERIVEVLQYPMLVRNGEERFDIEAALNGAYLFVPYNLRVEREIYDQLAASKLEPGTCLKASVRLGWLNMRYVDQVEVRKCPKTNVKPVNTGIY